MPPCSIVQVLSILCVHAKGGKGNRAQMPDSFLEHAKLECKKSFSTRSELFPALSVKQSADLSIQAKNEKRYLGLSQ